VTARHKVVVQNLECTAWAIEKETRERIPSPAVSIEMAVKVGWYGKSGSKWQTMPEVMLRYRAASFFGKLYAPELLMGLQSVEEMQDIVIDATPDARGGYAVDLETLRAGALESAVEETVDTDTGEILDQQQDAALREVEERGRTDAAKEWWPTPEERAHIHAREMAEAGGDENDEKPPRTRRTRGNLDIG
jgi:hypothetical protein